MSIARLATTSFKLVVVNLQWLSTRGYIFRRIRQGPLESKVQYNFIPAMTNIAIERSYFLCSRYIQ